MKSLAGLFSVLFLAALSAACQQNDLTGPTLGVVLPLTGGEANLGSDARRGIELAVGELNATGGIGGRKVLAIYEDSQGEPQQAVLALQRLVHEHQVQAVLGDLSSGPTLAMASIAEAEGVIFVTPTASAPAHVWTGTRVFRLSPAARDEAESAAKWALGQGFRKAALVSATQDWAFEQAEGFRSVYQAGGGQLLTAQRVGSDELDFRDLLQSIQADQPGLVYVAMDGIQAGRLLRQARDLGIKSHFVATGVAAETEGIVIVSLSAWDPDNPTPEQKVFAEKFRQRFQSEPQWASAYANDSARAVLEAFRSGAHTTSEIEKFLSGKLDLQGVTGRVSFQRDGQRVTPPPIVRLVHAGRLVAWNGGY